MSRFFRMVCRRYKMTLPNKSQSGIVPVKTPRILITGGCGQLGGSLATAIRKSYDKDRIWIADDVDSPSADLYNTGRFIKADVTDLQSFRSIIQQHEIDWIFYFSTMLQTICNDKDVYGTACRNVKHAINVIQVASESRCRLFVPSSFASFGPESTLDLTPNICVQRPKTIYGITKVFSELLGEFYHHSYGLDFRCLRLPGIISLTQLPSGGTADYAIDVFKEIAKRGTYECHLRPDTSLPMMYVDDCVRAIIEFMEVPEETVQRRVYNVTGVSFCPEELFAEIKRKVHDATFSYKPDHRQKIADSWPTIIDDSLARAEWGWKHSFGVEEIVDVMLQGVESDRGKQ